MYRLFTALRPPDPVRARLLALMGGVPGAHWQQDAQLHLTLRYIGEVPGSVAEDAASALSGVRHPAIEASLDGVGRFESRGRTHTLWAGVRPHAPLEALHRKIDQALIRTGLAPEHRAFLPHITLARLSGGAGGVEGFLAQHAGLSSPPFAMASFAMYRSHLGSGGARYEPLVEYPLV